MPLMFAAAHLCGQQPTAAHPQFEAASVKLSPERAGEARYVKMSTDKSRIIYTNLNLRLLVSFAYGVGDTRILNEPPAWMASTPYDITATIPPGVSKEQIPATLQSLLEERFALSVRWTAKMASGYRLVAGKHGAKLKPADPEIRRGGYVLLGRISTPQTNMASLAEILSHFTHFPVVDETGMEGKFDIDLQWTPEGPKDAVSAGGDDPSLYQAPRERLGLELVSQKAQVQYLVIEHANRIPYEN